MDALGFRPNHACGATKQSPIPQLARWMIQSMCGLMFWSLCAGNPMFAQGMKPAQLQGNKSKTDKTTPTDTRPNTRQASAERPQPKRIWSDPESPGGEESGDVFFRRVMDLPDVEKAYAEIETSAGTEVFFNGRRVRTIKPNSGKERIDVSGLIRPGKNCLSIRAQNPGDRNPGIQAEFYF